MRCFLNLKVLFLFAFIPLPTTGICQQFFNLNDPTVTHRLDRYVEVFVDSSDGLSIYDLTQGGYANSFRKVNGNLTFGYLPTTLWLKIQTFRPTPEDKWLLDIPAPFLEYVDFYQVSADGTWEHSVSGYFRKHSERVFSHTGHTVFLNFGPDSTNTTYVRIAGVSPKTFTVLATEQNEFVRKTRIQDLEYGIFFGILFIMLVYNLYIGITLGQTNYYLYALIIAFTGLILATISGYAGKFVWPEHPVFNFIFGKLALEGLIACLTLYTISFLDVRRYSRIMYYALVSLLPLSAVALTLAAAEIATAAGNNLVTLATVVFLTTGVVVRVRGNKAGTHFFAAWAVYFLGGLLLTLRNSGFFDFNFWTTHFVEIGAMLGIALMGLGLAAEYRRLEKEKEEAQLLAYRMQQEDTTRLEIKVSERTEQLHKANRELQKTIETNRKQTQIIENKNAELDSFFHRVSHDLKGPVLSSLGLIALARMEVKDKIALEYIDRQHSQLERLSHIINGLVDLTRLNNNDLRREQIDFPKMIDDCIGSLRHVPQFLDVRIEKEIHEHAPFVSEWTLVNAILQNLIENSIKYCRGDSPYVKVRILQEDQNIVLEVEDNGLGIPVEHQQKIFEMFYRATEKANGSGLGLYILKRSVDRLNGTISINSHVGIGSIFTVKLPIQYIEQDASS